MLNRPMVFRLTQSQRMKDKLSFIWYNMIILTGGWRVGGGGGVGGQYTWGFWRSECKWVKISQRKRSQNYHGIAKYGAPSKFFFPTWKVVLGAYSDQWHTPGLGESVSEWMIDSFRFGDSYRISDLCELGLWVRTKRSQLNSTKKVQDERIVDKIGQRKSERNRQWNK